MEGTKPQLIFENLWQQKATPLHAEVRLMWKKHFSGLTDDQVNTRLEQLVFVVRTQERKVVGVSTAHKVFIPQLKNYLYMGSISTSK